MARPPETSHAPAFESELLSSIAVAMDRRRKAIRHGGARRFEMERESDPEGPERHEWLNVHINTLGARSPSMRLSVRSDGYLWFSAAQPGPSRQGGWRLMLSFHGDVGAFTPEEVVEAFKDSVSCLAGLSDPGEVSRDLLALWRQAGPSVDRNDHTG
jgi:hypothetical protein